jgi:hypothetical protein
MVDLFIFLSYALGIFTFFLVCGIAADVWEAFQRRNKRRY